MPTKNALILGASGLVGGFCLQELLKSPLYHSVTAPVRRPLAISHPKLTAPVVDFNCIENYPNLFPADDLFICTGTTMKKAGSKEAFYQVDFALPYAIAQRAGNARCFIVSSIGANATSPFYYLKVKGELEAALRQLPLTAVHVFRPSVILGNRPELREGERIGEAALNLFSFALVGSLKKYRGIEAATIACAMVKAASAPTTGFRVYESDEIEQMAHNPVLKP